MSDTHDLAMTAPRSDTHRLLQLSHKPATMAMPRPNETAVWHS